MAKNQLDRYLLSTMLETDVSFYSNYLGKLSKLHCSYNVYVHAVLHGRAPNASLTRLSHLRRPFARRRVYLCSRASNQATKQVGRQAGRKTDRHTDRQKQATNLYILPSVLCVTFLHAILSMCANVYTHICMYILTYRIYECTYVSPTYICRATCNTAKFPLIISPVRLYNHMISHV